MLVRCTTSRHTKRSTATTSTACSPPVRSARYRDDDPSGVNGPGPGSVVTDQDERERALLGPRSTVNGAERDAQPTRRLGHDRLAGILFPRCAEIPASTRARPTGRDPCPPLRRNPCQHPGAADW